MVQRFRLEHQLKTSRLLFNRNDLRPQQMAWIAQEAPADGTDAAGATGQKPPMDALRQVLGSNCN